MHHTLYGYFCAFPCHNVLINVRREIFSAYLLLFSGFQQKYAIRWELLNSSVLFNWFWF